MTRVSFLIFLWFLIAVAAMWPVQQHNAYQTGWARGNETGYAEGHLDGEMEFAYRVGGECWDDWETLQTYFNRGGNLSILVGGNFTICWPLYIGHGPRWIDLSGISIRLKDITYADYTCDGTTEPFSINAQINALPSSPTGRVELVGNRCFGPKVIDKCK